MVLVLMTRHMDQDLRESVAAFPAADAARHDLANLLDAALRSASAARRAGDPAGHIAAIEAALAQMADLLAVMTPAGRVRGARDIGLSIADAVTHACDIMRAPAAEQGVTINAAVGDGLCKYAAPGIYRALTDAIRNSIESISVARCAAGGAGGTVSVSARIDGDRVRIDIEDDGGGPPVGQDNPLERSAGLGLTVVRHVVSRLKGSASLEPGRGNRPGRIGAVLRIVIPLESLSVVGDGAT